MKKKHQGMCPHCEKKVRPAIVEKCTYTRDVLRCPSCRTRLVVCRNPSCSDFAQGGEGYDDQWCDPCFKDVKRYSMRAAVWAITTYTGTDFLDKLRRGSI